MHRLVLPTLQFRILSIFFKNKLPFYGLHYNADYEVREWEGRAIKLDI